MLWARQLHLLNHNWVASGHVGSFSDPLIDCKGCRERFRADHLLEAKLGDGCAIGKSNDEISAMITENEIACPRCGKRDFTSPRSFNLMFKTRIGVVEGTGTEVYLRPETAQGIFLNFKVIAENCRQKVPFGIEIGKIFRNEITPTSSFALENLSRWRWSFFASREQKMSGLPSGKSFAWSGSTSSGSIAISFACATTILKNSRIIPRGQQTLSTSSPLVGASFGALQAALILT